ncbi:hypothetical protein Pmani_028560 [Petrolisthes manimaculis]|uniref:Uncharacterized protein n=1 Tax=Petrolisthes manimaculis TaxID=1843537 RepID=A0AAE1P1F5_9EUCA|nr:hypothetical protein Pmani_028560 [Petrolisthes manimaculis]
MKKEEYKDEEEEYKEYDYVAPDGGWAWIVTLACFVLNTFSCIPYTCFGIVFSQHLISLGTSSILASTVFNSSMVLSGIMGFLACPLVTEFGYRKVGFVTFLVFSLGFLMSSQATSASFLIFSYSILVGAVAEIPINISYAIIPNYFSRWRNVANSMTTSGMSVSQIVTPYIITFLQEEYGYKGATLIIGAIILNGCAASLVLHPVEWHRRRVYKPLKNTSSSISTTTINNSDIQSSYNSDETFYNSSSSISTTTNSYNTSDIQTSYNGDTQNYNSDETFYNSSSSNPTATNNSDMQTSYNGDTQSYNSDAAYNIDSDTQTYNRNESNTTSFKNKNHNTTTTTTTTTHEASATPTPTPTTPRQKQKKQQNKSEGNTLVRVFKEIRDTFQYIKSLRVLLVSCQLSMLFASLFNFFAFVPFAMLEEGFTQRDASFCITVAGMCNLMFRLAMAFLACYPQARVRYVYIFGSLLSATSVICFSFSSTLVFKVFTSAVCGVGYGMTGALYNLVIVEELGMDMLFTTLSISSLLLGFLYAVMGPVAGLLRDLTGNYTSSMCFCGGSLIASSVLGLCSTKVLSYQQSHNKYQKFNSHTEYKHQQHQHQQGMKSKEEKKNEDKEKEGSLLLHSKNIHLKHPTYSSTNTVLP